MPEVVDELRNGLKLGRFREAVELVLADDSDQLVLASFSDGQGELSRGAVRITDKEGPIWGILELLRDLLPETNSLSDDGHSKKHKQNNKLIK